MDISEATAILGDRILCLARLRGLSWPISLGDGGAPAVPFSRDVLLRVRDTHILVYAPSHDAAGRSIDLMFLRAAFGTDTAQAEPCFYNQDWYAREAFVASPLDGNWHLLPVRVMEDARAVDPGVIEKGLPPLESFPAAVTCAFAFFAWWFATGGEKLWRHDFVWCRDRDDNQDRIYVGRYDDPKGFSKSGFSIHRHLALRRAYSAAPELSAET